MVRKIIITGILLFVIFNAMLYLLPIKKRFVYTDVEKSERFLYAGRKFSVITAGSSLIGNFTFETEKRKNYFNLSLPPSGGCTGVKILALTNNIPDTLYLETNYISRGSNNVLIDGLLDKRSYYAKLIFPALQEQNKFFPLIIDKFKSGNTAQASKRKPKDDLFLQLFASTKEEYSKPVNLVSYNKTLRELKKHLEYLSAKGTFIAFFEVPIEHDLINSPKLVSQRQALKLAFADKKYNWIQPDTINRYYTGDGKHLLEESFVRFTKYFKTQCNLLKQQGKK